MNIKNAGTKLAKYFDHTNLNISSSCSDIYKLCEEAVHYEFYSVVVYPIHVCDCNMILDGTDVKVCTVVGFPHGRSDTETKELELVLAAEQGAHEIDVVMDHSMLRAQHEEQVSEEIRRLSDTAKRLGVVLKVIVETSELTDEQKLTALKICEDAEVGFIKTSTGFSSNGALVEDVRLFNSNKEYIQIKASGGIKTLEQASKFISAGATRLGSSSGVSIMEEFYSKYSKDQKIINLAKRG
jgi:deoxyribose-phosphate aldolase